MTAPSPKVQNREAALQQIARWREHGQKIVFTNGCFDILHPGHIKCLRSARDLGDRLVVGLNSDGSVKRLKGSSRPVIDERGRQMMLEALRFVDLVLLFEEDTPSQLIQAIGPDVLVKGDEYEVQNIAGANFVLEAGGQVQTIPMEPMHSTTELIKRIKNL